MTPPKASEPPSQTNGDSLSLDEELDRRHRNSEKALLEATEDDEQRDSLISFSDVEELTGNVARQTAKGVAEALKSKHPKVEVSGTWGPFAILIKGPVGRVLILIIAIVFAIVLGRTFHGIKISFGGFHALSRIRLWA